ncbi:MAG: hypothetical protein D6769_03340, partial [Methanobacteriota archaeon]
VKEITNIDVKDVAVRIRKAVGKRKRAAIVEKAKELSLRVLNPGKVANAGGVKNIGGAKE